MRFALNAKLNCQLRSRLPFCLAAIDQWRDWTASVWRTPCGNPDLRGTWPLDYLNGTPVQRPAAFGDRRFLTDDEYAERVERLAGLNARYDDEIAANKMGIGH